MGATIVLEGLEDLRKALRDIPRDLRDEGKQIVRDAAEAAAADLRGVYPSGPLREGIKLDFSDNAVSVTARLRSTARTKDGTDLASAWEFGTQNRITAKGWKRGSGPAHPDRGVIGIAKKHRLAMYRLFTPLLERLGFSVSGSVFD